MSWLWNVLSYLVNLLLREKPDLEFLSPSSQHTFFCPVVDSKAFETNNEILYTNTLLVFSCNIQNRGGSKAFITEYQLKVNEFNYSTDSIKPKDYRYRRVERSDGRTQIELAPEPKFNTSSGSLEIDELTALDGVELPFFIPYADEHREFDSINATVTMIHRQGKLKSRKFSFITELVRR